MSNWWSIYDYENIQFNEKNQMLGKDTKCKIPKISRRSWLYTADESESKELIKVSSMRNVDSLPILIEQIQMNQKILKLQEELGVTIVQKNGQRQLGGPPPGWTGPAPGPGCEVFVGRIPRSVYEDVIYPIFSKVGEIYEMRLMMNFSGTNRGFCFIMYTKPEYAQRAIKKLNNYEIYPGWTIGVVQSVNNCRLHITGLLSNTDPEFLIKKLWPALDEIDTISVYTSINNQQSKHALLSFKTHRSAAMARRTLLPERNKYFNKSEVRVEWAHPQFTVNNVIKVTGSSGSKGELVFTHGMVQNCKKLSYDRKKQTTKNFRKGQNVESFKNLYKSMQKVSIKENNCKSKSISSHFRPNFFNKNESLDDDISDEFRCSIRSDESLSKNSEFDESQNSYYQNSDSSGYESQSLDQSYCINNCNTFSQKINVPIFLNPANCSVIQYPWNVNSDSFKKFNSIRKSVNNNHVQFPWAQLGNRKDLNVAWTQMHIIQNNNNISNHVLSKGFVVGTGGMKNPRPILNRNF